MSEPTKRQLTITNMRLVTMLTRRDAELHKARREAEAAADELANVQRRLDAIRCQSEVLTKLTRCKI